MPQRGTILGVDDEPDSVAFLKVLFEGEGYNFLPAESGAQALELIRARRPDLLVVDYMMPGMNGLEFCDLVRSDFSLRHIPIVLYSAYQMRPHSNLGLYDVAFLKPVDADDLLWAIRALLPEP
jgi:CheY-like chemotaxis protein